MSDLVPKDRVVAVWADESGVTVARRIAGRTELTGFEYRGFLLTSERNVAQHVDVLSIADVDQLAGSGLCFRLRPKEGSSIEALAERISCCTPEHVWTSPKYYVPSVEQAFMFDTQTRLFQNLPDEEIRVAFVHLVVRRNSQSTYADNMRDPANVLVSAAVDCAGKTSCFAGSEYEVAFNLKVALRAFDPDVVVGFNLASSRMAKVLASADPTFPPHLVGPLTLPGCAIIDLEKLCAKDRKGKAPRDVSELAQRCGFEHHELPRGRVRLEGTQAAEAAEEAAAGLEACVRLGRTNLRGFVELSRRFPLSLQDLVHEHPARQIETIMIDRYLRRGHAIPQRTLRRAEPRGGGGRIETPGQGHFTSVAHLDVVSAYPTIIASKDFAPSGDALRVYPALVRELLDCKNQAEAGSGYDGRSNSAGMRAFARLCKKLAVVAFGSLRWEKFLFYDRELQSEIASVGRAIAGCMMETLEQEQCDVLAIETDGALFTMPRSDKSLEELRVDVETQLRVATEIPELRLRTAGPYSSILLTPRLRLAKGGRDRGWTHERVSAMSECLRCEIVERLHRGDRDGAVAVVRDIAELLQKRAILGSDIAVPYAVETPPRYAAARGRDQQALAALASGAVHGEVIGLIKLACAGGDNAWSEVRPELEHEYDPEWALAELRRALAPLERCFAVSLLFAGEAVDRIVSSRLDKRPEGRAHTKLLAGLKTERRQTAVEFAEYGSRLEEEAFLAEHPDAHALLYGFYGARDANVSLAARVRTGDFVIEFEHKVRDDLPLIASRAFLTLLRQFDVVLARDVRVMFNGHRSIVLRIRQSALSVQDCVELPSLYATFAAALWDRMCGAVDTKVGVLYDSQLYASNASYRVAGCVHQENGFRATWLSAEDLEQVGSLDELRGAPQGRIMEPFADRSAVPALRALFDAVTERMPRTTTHDARSRTRNGATVARKQRAERHEKLRLQVLRKDEATPCLEAIQRRIECGDSIGFAPLAKAIYEFRVRGGERREFARLMVEGAGGPTRYESRLDFTADGPDLVDGLWREHAESSYHRSCASEGARQLCEFARCFRSREPQVFNEEMSPTYAEARQRARTGTAEMSPPSNAGIVAYEVPPRSGKTWRLSEIAVEEAFNGNKVLLIGPSHNALGEAARFVEHHMRQHVLPPAFRVVHLLGRGTRREFCRADQRHRLTCTGCPCAPVVEDNGTWLPNPRLARVSVANGTVVTREVSQARAEELLCARTVSHHLARGAAVVLASEAHFTNDRFAESSIELDFDVVLLDESDALLDTLGSGPDHLVLARARATLTSPLESACDMKCETCYLDFTEYPSLDDWSGTHALPDLAAHNSPRTLFESVRRGVDEIETDPALAPDVDVLALRRNLSALESALPAHDSIARGHHVSPKDYNVALSRLARGRGHTGELTPGEDVALFVPMVPCIGKDAPPAFIDRQWWRHRLVSDDVSPAVRAAADVADFFDRAARTGDGVLLVPQTKPGSWATWMKGCTVELRLVERRRLQRIRKFLQQRRTMLVSGTQPEPALLKATFGELEIKRVDVPLHRDATLFVHTVPRTGRSDAFVPRRYSAPEVVDLAVRIFAQVARNTERRQGTSIHIYARSRGAQRTLLLEAESRELKGVDVVSASNGTVDTNDRRARLIVDYLRSPTSRAVDADSDVIVVFGSGYPNFAGYHGFLQILSAELANMPVDVLAEDSRRRAVIQALMRSAAVPGRRAMVLLNDMTVADLPAWMHHRTIAADSLYHDLGELSTDLVAETQRGRLAEAIAAALRLRAELPSEREILEWAAKPGAAPGSRRVAANKRRVADMLARAARGELFRPRDKGVGATEDWIAFLRWLEARGVLERVSGQSGHAYRFTTAGYATFDNYHLE